MTQRERTKRFFGDLISEERINAPRVIPIKEQPDDEMIHAILWDAFNGRGKRSAQPIIEDDLAIEYDEDLVEAYLKEVKDGDHNNDSGQI